MTHGQALDVDGPRPAVAWVSRLPAAWLLPADRQVLLVLALDTYDQAPPFTASPSTADLTRWTGEHKGTLLTRIRRLSEPLDGQRPPLLEVTPGTGRRRSTYRLRTEHGPPLWSGSADHYGRGSGRSEQTTTSGRSEQTTTGRSGLRSGLASSRSEQTTPYPYPSVPTHSSPLTDRARDDQEEGATIDHLEQLGLDRTTAAEMLHRAASDPATRDPARRLDQPAYRAELLDQIHRDRTRAEADARRCPHGTINGRRQLRDGSRLCHACTLEDASAAS